MEDNNIPDWLVGYGPKDGGRDYENENRVATYSRLLYGYSDEIPEESVKSQIHIVDGKNLHTHKVSTGWWGALIARLDADLVLNEFNDELLIKTATNFIKKYGGRHSNDRRNRLEINEANGLIIAILLDAKDDDSGNE